MFEIETVELCDGYERVQKKVRSGKTSFSFDLEKYEVKTFALTLKKRRGAAAYLKGSTFRGPTTRTFTGSASSWAGN